MAVLINRKRYSALDIFLILVISILYLRAYALLFSKNTALATWLFYAFIALSFVLSFFIIISYRIQGPTFAVLVLLVTIIGLMLYAFIKSSYKDPNENNALIGRIVALVLLYAVFVNKNIFSISIIKFNTFVNLIYAWFFVIQYFFGNPYTNKGLTFNYSNPNTAGLSLLLMIYSLVVGLFFYRNHLFKVLIVCSMIVPIVILYQTNSRSAFFSLVLFVLIIILKGFKFNKSRNKRKDKGKRVPSLYSPVLLICLQAFVIVYPLIWATLFTYVQDKGITFFRKSLFSGRELIWKSMFDELFASPFSNHFGQTVPYSSGPHNVFLSIWWDYGLIAFVLFNVLIWIIYNSLNKKGSTFFDAIVLALMFSLFLSMSFESILFSGGVDFMFRAYLLLFFIGLTKKAEVVNRVQYNCSNLQRRQIYQEMR